MAKIVFLDRAGLAEHIVLQPLTAERGESHQLVEYATTTPAKVVERLDQAQVAIVNKVVISKDVLAHCPSLRHVAVAATGYNNIDLDACRECGVSVSNIPAYATTSVPEHTLMMMLALRRQLPAYRARVIAGEWGSSPVFCLFAEPIKDLSQSTLGIIGYGDIGRATARLARALGMQVLYTSRSLKPDTPDQRVSLNELLAQADVVSLHCALNESTKNLIGANELARMRSNALLLNTARGGLVDEAALAHAITTHQIGGIGFDVLSQEPPSSSPLIALSDRPNVIITPHIAWASDQAMQGLADILIDNVNAFLLGSPQNIVS